MSAALKLRTQHRFSKAAHQYQRNARVQAISSEFLLSHIGPRPLGMCLDLGAGPGVNSATLAHQSELYLALDLSPDMLAQIDVLGAKLCADMDALPIADNTLDTVFSNFAMQWSDDITHAFSELYRVLKPGGRAFLAIVAHDSLREVKHAFAQVGRCAINDFHQPETLASIAKCSGFVPVWQYQRELYDHFSNGQQALKSLSAIGATSSSSAQKPITKEQYQGVLRALQDKGNEVKLSYNVVFMELIK